MVNKIVGVGWWGRGGLENFVKLNIGGGRGSGVGGGVGWINRVVGRFSKA